mmetsp:Transcript_26185/g.68767  ORF Transcript_26185/g.68767 Transcript_26185/m.68767 type:complete len:847 (+) Transcript_26185:3-2543(+)
MSNSALVVLTPSKSAETLDAEKIVLTLDRSLRKRPIVMHASGALDSEPIMAVSASRALPRRVPREISTKRLMLLDKLGEGNFAEVHLAQLDESDRHMPPYPVAAKVLKGGLDAEVRKSFLREAALMAMLDHQNIVRLVGVCTVPRDLPPLLLMQYCDRGSLEYYLRECATEAAVGSSSLNDTVKLTFAGDVCCGLQYLASCRIVHRDVAARNVLLDAAFVCRIGDFGQAQSLSDNKEYLRMFEQVAVRWAAVEVLDEDKFSAASDVWSFGVVVHEIMSMGAQPYEDLQTNTMVIDFVTSGEVMKRHSLCPPTIYNQLILPCWKKEPEERPSYEDIFEVIVVLGGARYHDPEAVRQVSAVTDFEMDADEGTAVITLEDRKLLAPSVWHLDLRVRAKVESIVEENLRHVETPPRGWPKSLADTEITHVSNLYTKPLTADATCPRDLQSGCAYVDILSGPDNIGRATAMLTHSWNNRAFDIIDALDAWCTTHKRSNRRVYIWMDAFCLNLHRDHKAQALDAVKADLCKRLTSIGRCISFMDPWDQPQFVTRAWCLYELFTAISLGDSICTVNFALSPAEEKRFTHAIHGGGYSKFDAILANISSRNARATYKSDLDLISEEIKKVPGTFDKIDSLIRQHIRSWAYNDRGAVRTNNRLYLGVKTGVPTMSLTDSGTTSQSVTSSGYGSVYGSASDRAVHGHGPAKATFYRRREGNLNALPTGVTPEFPLERTFVDGYSDFLLPFTDDVDNLVPDIPHFRGQMHRTMQRLAKNNDALRTFRRLSMPGRNEINSRRSRHETSLWALTPPHSMPPQPSQLPPLRLSVRQHRDSQVVGRSEDDEREIEVRNTAV